MIKQKMPITILKRILLVLLFICFQQISKGQIVGDYISIVSGNWATSSTWGVVTGTGPLTWTVAGSPPAAGNNVFVRGGNSVTLTASGLCTNLTVQSAGKLFTNNSTPGSNIYISVSGNITCDGQIGNTPTLDNICFNIESVSCLISGTGLFDACRIRKNSAAVPTTNLTISMNINLWFAASSSTQLYNNSTDGIFNVIISAGAIVNLLASGANGWCTVLGMCSIQSLTLIVVRMISIMVLI